MKANIVIALLEIAQKPGASKSTSLITTRRLCRILGGEGQVVAQLAGLPPYGSALGSDVVCSLAEDATDRKSTR